MKVTASFYQTPGAVADDPEPVAIADNNTEALAEALTENSEAPVESFSYLQGADGSLDCDLED